LESLAEWVAQSAQLRARLKELPPLDETRLWKVQARAIHNLEASFSRADARALIQMATGSGKTFTAVNISYRLLKHANAKRILFLVDRGNLGRQTEDEFANFEPPDDPRKFPQLYTVQRLKTNSINPAAKVVNTTIQRLYSMLKGETDFDADDEEGSGFDSAKPWRGEPPEVAYNPGIAPEFFDLIIVDECHGSIYELWSQVLLYFDAFLIGLTATPAGKTIGFFNQNLVMQYGHDEAVTDGVNVDFDVYRIRTRITEQGATIDETRHRDKGAGIGAGIDHRLEDRAHDGDPLRILRHVLDHLVEVGVEDVLGSAQLVIERAVDLDGACWRHQTLSRRLEQLVADDLQVRRVDACAAAGLFGEAREQDIVGEVFVIIDPEARLLQRPEHGFAGFGGSAATATLDRRHPLPAAAAATGCAPYRNTPAAVPVDRCTRETPQRYSRCRRHAGSAPH
jgi:hypothetical protein